MNCLRNVLIKVQQFLNHYNDIKMISNNLIEKLIDEVTDALKRVSHTYYRFLYLKKDRIEQ